MCPHRNSPQNLHKTNNRATHCIHEFPIFKCKTRALHDGCQVDVLLHWIDRHSWPPAQDHKITSHSNNIGTWVVVRMVRIWEFETNALHVLSQSLGYLVVAHQLVLRMIQEFSYSGETSLHLSVLCTSRVRITSMPDQSFQRINYSEIGIWIDVIHKRFMRFWGLSGCRACALFWSVGHCLSSAEYTQAGGQSLSIPNSKFIAKLWIVPETGTWWNKLGRSVSSSNWFAR